MALSCPMCGRSFDDTTPLCPFDGAKLHPVELLRSDPLIGAVIDGRYEVTRKIGAGGMGAVYVGLQKSVGREVAIKVMLPDPNADERADQRFVREAQAASMLRSPHTVVVFDFGTSEGRHFLAMELLQGRSLKQLLREQPHLPPQRAIEIFSQICDSLAEAHARGFVHRDIKPDNIYLVETEGVTDFVKVLDFGIAKRVNEGRDAALTATGQILGTPAYLAPEVARGELVTPAADIYATGVLLFEMLCGRRPYVHDVPSALLLAHVQEPIPRLADIGIVEPPVVLQRLVDHLLAKNPASRPASAIEARDLARSAIPLLGQRAAVALQAREPLPVRQAGGGSGHTPRTDSLARSAPLSLLIDASDSLAAPRRSGLLRWAIPASAALLLAGGLGLMLALCTGGKGPTGTADRPAGPALDTGPATAPPPPVVTATTDVGTLPAPRTVTLDSVPSRASVLREGVLLGQTPLRVELAPGGAPMDLVLRARGRIEARVLIGPDTPDTLSVPLRRAAPRRAPPGEAHEPTLLLP
jgi:serine/threonine-protein kinase